MSLFLTSYKAKGVQDVLLSCCLATYVLLGHWQLSLIWLEHLWACLDLFCSCSSIYAKLLSCCSTWIVVACKKPQSHTYTWNLVTLLRICYVWDSICWVLWCHKHPCKDAQLYLCGLSVWSDLRIQVCSMMGRYTEDTRRCKWNLQTEWNMFSRKCHNLLYVPDE